ncbi:MAG: hypothetical protein IPM86_02885 [Saprospiraceae bacterium]|nr:hypothetical protein [Saprospiraceae bacterium]
MMLERGSPYTFGDLKLDNIVSKTYKNRRSINGSNDSRYREDTEAYLRSRSDHKPIKLIAADVTNKTRSQQVTSARSGS